MEQYKIVCPNYLDENSPDFLVEYRGPFKEEIDKVTYACGDIITDTLGVISVPYEYLDILRKDVPSIVFVENRSIYVLQDVIVNYVDNINEIKLNPYLGLNGRGVLVGMVDSGIDYLNNEFIREDGTSRILNIWDQTAPINYSNKKVYIGDTYDNDKINEAINASKRGEDPYAIVPTKDEIDHGTKMAGIIGGRGYNEDIRGVASDSDFVIVKLLESLNYKRMLRENGILNVPGYNNVEVLAGIEYLRRYAENAKKPMVVYIGVGTTSGSHSGNNIMSRYINAIAAERGLAIVAGVGNEGDSEGHASGTIKAVDDVALIELSIPRVLKELSFEVWIRKPDIMSINISTPYGEMSGFIDAKIKRVGTIKFVLTNSSVNIRYNVPEEYTGDEVIGLTFKDMKPGIWRLELKGEDIVKGRYDMWLPPKATLPEGTRFLASDPFITLTVPSTAKKVITVAYYNSQTKSLVASSGKGFNSNGLINPDIMTAGIDVLTTSNGGAVTKTSGSSVATAIVAGCCSLILQWGIVDKNDTTMYSAKILSYLIYGADRTMMDEYPNRYSGYGVLDILKTFNVMGGIYRSYRNSEFIEYYVGNLYVKIPSDKEEGYKINE
ncbi:S8 family peptidase [Clostridium gasigenes]|uniref:Subtilase family protein n=1 Tax=Clostridium gasigenes TaxID=94869 RepID=A0A1H0LNQ5_9CLOT|nr:S8 family peptidase [Clostridium gasigenes]MBU3087215.1 S8 family peptidase [Clostridium gasigenes]SDO69673.1 Subtilase family protein [Clostridium gasigenes]